MQRLAAGEAHIWTAHNGSGAGPGARLAASLSPREQAAAARFVLEKHGQTYTFAHAFLRDVLSRYTGLAPAELNFYEHDFGKPFLTAADAPQFNLSHSGDVVMLAVTRDRQVGVDVEKIRTVMYRASIAESNFTAHEQAFLSRHSAGLENEAFFRCWCRKESYIKAVGKGLAIPLNTFDTSIAEGDAGRWLPRTVDAPHVERWWLADVTAPDGYLAALTVEGGFDGLQYFAWTPEQPI